MLGRMARMREKSYCEIAGIHRTLHLLTSLLPRDFRIDVERWIIGNVYIENNYIERTYRIVIVATDIICAKRLKYYKIWNAVEKFLSLPNIPLTETLNAAKQI